MSTTKLPINWKRNASFFLAGQFLSTFGSMLVAYAITWQITLEQKSGILISLFTAATMLPMVFISPLAGVWADRFNRKYLINLADGAIAVVTLVVALFYQAGFTSIWLLLAAAIVRSIGQGIQQPAGSALIPQIVPPKSLTRFNGIQTTMQSIAMFASPMAAGALLTFLPLQSIFFIDVVTAIIGIATVFFCVKVAPLARKKETVSGIKAYYHDLKEGVQFIRQQAWLKTLLMAMAVFMIFASPSAMLTPLQVARSFGDDVWRLTTIELAFSVGMMVGGIIISAWGGFVNKVKTMTLSWVLFSIATILFGVVPNFWIYLGVMLFCGSVMPLFNTPAMTLMQTKIPPELMGRVLSVVMMINGIAMPLGMLIFGPLSDKIAIEKILVVTGILLMARGIIFVQQKSLFAAGLPATGTKKS